MEMPTEPVSISFSQDEALVLFEWVTRVTDDEAFGEFLPVGSAEWRVLNNLAAAFEPLLVQPFAENYTELLEKARDHVRDQWSPT